MQRLPVAKSRSVRRTLLRNRSVRRFLRAPLPHLIGLGLLVALSCGLVTAWRPLPTLADPKPAATTDRTVALVVSQLMQRDHVNRNQQRLDDLISQRCLKTFLKSLDPMKVYFYQSDIDRFTGERNNLDDRVKKGDISFAHTVFQTFLKRIDERVAIVDKLLETKHDFTVDELIITDGDAAKYPTNEAEANDRWRRRIKYDLLVIKASDKDKYDAKKTRERLGRRYHSFARRMHQTNSDDLLEMFLTAMTTGFDPHTTYMSPTSLENFYIEMRKQLDGIGAALQMIDGYCVISKIIPGGAADKEGSLKPEDRVIGVGQDEDGEIVDVVDNRLSDVVKLIRGKKGTVVRLEVLKGGQGEKKIIKITRAKIELKDSIARGEVFSEGKKADGQPYKVGVIDLQSFYMDMDAARRNQPDFRSTTRDVRRIIKDFKTKNVDTVILDLRRNGGGSLKEAINLTGLFIDGPVLQVKGPDGRVKRLDDDPKTGTEWDGPLVVLTSKVSASASEIFAGAMQDYHRGLIVGDHATHGKGTVQSLLDVGQELYRRPNAKNLGALKITIQQFYRPSGDSTQKRGVLADVELPSLTTHLDVSEDDLDFALDFDKVPGVRHDIGAMVNDRIIAALKSMSKVRTDKSEDFDKVRKNIARYLKQKKQKSISLNEKKFMARRKEFAADKAEEDKIKDLNDPNRPVIKRDFYFNEVLAVTLDYLSLVKKEKPALQN